MANRKRNLRIGLAALALLLVGTEVVMRAARVPGAELRVINLGSGTITDLVVTCDGRRVAMEPIAPGASATASLRARDKVKLALNFRQPRCAFSAVALDDFEPPRLESDGERMVLELLDDGYRFVAEEVVTPDERRAQGIWQSIEAYLDR